MYDCLTYRVGETLCRVDVACDGLTVGEYCLRSAHLGGAEVAWLLVSGAVIAWVIGQVGRP